MMRYLCAVLWVIAMAHPAAAQSNDRVALVIGNAAYEHTSRLRNPVNDADAMKTTLEGLGFDVTQVTDANQSQMLRALTAFTRRAAGADTAVVFYSGHGMEMGRDNYLIPVEARLDDEWSGRQESVSLRRLRDAVSRTRRLSVVIVDACRDNRFPSSVRGSKGMGPVDNRPGEVIAFATQPGAVAQDGAGDLSPFTTALVERLRASPNQDVRILFSSLRLSEQGQDPSVEMGRLPQTVVSLGGEASPNNRLSETPPNRPYSCMTSHNEQGVNICGQCWPLNTRVLETCGDERLGSDGIKAISELRDLVWLDLGSSEIVYDLSPLEKLHNLRGFVWEYEGNGVINISFLKNLTEMRFLGLENYYGENLDPLADLTNLRAIWMAEADNIPSFEPLINLTGLEYIEITADDPGPLMSLQDIRPLANLTKLRVLDIEIMPVYVRPLQNLEGLHYLKLYDGPSWGRYEMEGGEAFREAIINDAPLPISGDTPENRASVADAIRAWRVRIGPEE